MSRVSVREGFRLVLIVISLQVILLFLGSTVHSWPWREVRLEFEVHNGTGEVAHAIIGGGLYWGNYEDCLADEDPWFPNCHLDSIYIGRWGIDYVLGYLFGLEPTPDSMVRKIGFVGRGCLALAGVGVWLRAVGPPYAIAWFPLVGIECSSPVSFVREDTIRRCLDSVQYAVAADTIPYGKLRYDNRALEWHDAQLEYVCFESMTDTIEILGIPEESEIGDSVLFLRGIVTAWVVVDSVTEYEDTVRFTAQIYPVGPGVPGHSTWGLLILLFVLSLSAIYVISRRRAVARG